jgi:hypothetical protein
MREFIRRVLLNIRANIVPCHKSIRSDALLQSPLLDGPVKLPKVVDARTRGKYHARVNKPGNDCSEADHRQYDDDEYLHRDIRGI